MDEECKTTAFVDVEEGEISDSASVEEISKEAFNKQGDPSPPISSASSTAATAGKANSNGNVASDPKPARVWTMKDLYNNYPISRDYARGLYNLAWAQAVQNKPLDELFVMKKSGADASDKGSGEESKNDAIVIDVEDGVKEDEELEEGEIDLDSEAFENGDLKEVTSVAMVVGDAEEKVNLIKEELRSLTVEEAWKPFNEACSKLQRLLDSLHEIVSENSLSENEALAELFFTAIRTAIAVLYSMKQVEKEKHKDPLSRVLVGASRKMTQLFSKQQLHEVGKLLHSLDLSSISSKIEDGDKVSEMKVVQVVNENESDTSSVTDMFQDSALMNRMDLESMTANGIIHNESKMSIESSRQASKLRGLSLPLLDLHKDHDADSLPSPTRETQSLLPSDKALSGERGVMKPEFPFPRGALQMSNSVMHPYETDALKAVSSYQQKFGRSTFFTTDRLPSPTPSEDHDNGDTDIGEEISSSIPKNCNSLNTLGPKQLVVSSVPHVSISTAGSLSSAATPVSRSSPKIKDPRLRVLNNPPSQSFNLGVVPAMSNNENIIVGFGEMVGSRKQRTVDEPILGGPAIKRHKSEQTDSVIISSTPSYTGGGGWSGVRGDGFPVTNNNLLLKSMKDVSNLEQVTTAVTAPPTALNATVNAIENIPATTASITSTTSIAATLSAIENIPATTTSIAATLQSLLNDIAVNPSTWMDRFKMGQQRSMEPSKITAQSVSSSNSSLRGIPPMNVALPQSSPTDPRRGGIRQASPQIATPKDDLGKIRMKPRDPRRILHNPSIQKDEKAALDQTGGLIAKVQVEQLDKKPALVNSSAAPDISHLFTKNLKNIADMISVSQPLVFSPLASQSPPSQHTPVSQGKLEVKAVVSDSSQLPSSEVASVIHSRPQSSWGDVEHLFEGFDDQQKAAIQRERARRIEEQKKMFSAKKLSLVLDLDHTLLNSAKFVEVDPVHDEILRKKEEQEREKPKRHLFRFPHMAMWTKLRPGIWNFLEKASKLFELHLYTMGNKLYATEMAKLLDPKGDMFSGRVVSRGDDADLIDGDERVVPKSKDLEGVLGMESSVVIIDDSVRVWPHNKLNLIVVERYIYFPCSRRQFGLPGPSLLEIDHDERPEAGTLASSLAVIEKIHQMFFEHPSLDEADVRNILATEQRRILSGCRIVFSRVFPVGEANPHLHPLWQTAEQFGAVCTNQIDEKVTHVVANSLGTDKVNWALATGRFVVHPGWVEASALLYRRANEHDFAIKS
ncbi:unnamed protein product [Cuscuta epithymum]|uniref:protein-serine/threonine phosphatase n=1 Tax=Cuscuta epithymum TaxID=186058 RepID=A0AAV0BVG4_9ASTE|nr:unnamed protein product [Cuscuta epithymum]